jgi:2-polyprenyl-3-methyl-5-hydroxy-6-metoxy-1,4-benzoquinol methylase
MVKRLPDRYRVPDRRMFLDLVLPALRPGFNVLDMGSGRKPILSPSDRPNTLTYVGLDIAAQEMEKAGDGAYDEVVIADIGDHQPSLDGRFDAVISFQVLEHVKPLDSAFSNVQRYLKPGGVFMAYFSGRFRSTRY